MALMGSTAGFGATDLGADDSEYDAAVKSGDIRNVMAVLEKEYRLPAGYLAKTAQVESRMNPSAQNPNSSAGGLFQFINSTARRYGLTDKMDPVQSTLAAAQLAGDNADYLSGRLGRDPTTPELYAAHQQGAAGAAKILAQPNAMMTDLVGGRAASLNGAGNLTGGQFIDRFARKLGMNSPSTTVSTAPTPTFSEDDPTTTGSIGLMNKPPAPKEDEYPLLNGNMRDIIMAMGMSMMGGKKGDYFGRVPESYQSLQAMSAKAADRKYDMYKDNRDFGFRQGESQRAQANTDRSFSLQERQANMTAEERKIDNARLDAQLKLQQDNAARPDRVTTATGAVVDIPRDGSAPVERVPGQKAITLEAQRAERRAAAIAEGLQEGTPAFSTFVLTGKMANEDKAQLSAGDKQAIYKSEDALPQIDQTLETLRRAKELNPQTYTGTTAGAFGKIGTSVPGASMFFDQKKAQATREFGQIMSMEAIQSMSQTLKGATTDAEMARFMEILGDPSTPPEIRGRTIDRLTTLAQRQKELAEGRIKDLRGGDYFKSNRGQGGASVPAAPNQGAAFTQDQLQAEARRRGLIQ